MPVDFVRRVDSLVDSGRTPFVTREEFVVEAVRQLLIELEHGDQLLLTAPDVDPPSEDATRGSRSSTDRRRPSVRARGRAERARGGHDPGRRELALGPDGAAFELLADERPVEPLTDLAQTALAAPARRGVVFEVPEHDVADEPLFGLHNRDYPTLWAAQRLCEWTQREPMSLADFRSRATEEAAELARALIPLEATLPKGQPRLTALLPRQDARTSRPGGYFAQAALGSVHRDRDSGRRRLHGPLFVWRLAGLDELRDDRGSPRIAPTALCYELLDRLAGLRLDAPHDPEHTLVFVEHLRRHAAEDWRAFGILIGGAGRRATRDELLDDYRRAYGWGGKIPDTNLQGYIGRAREWGLLSPERGAYVLTELGEQVAATML